MIRTLIALFKPAYRYRRADTGKWCSKAYALANPTTTVRERVR